jgi:hypothetical protein
MPGIVRKLIISATANGLILQPLGGADLHPSLRVDFKSRTIGPHDKVEPDTFKQSPHLESHGIIGKLSILYNIPAIWLNGRDESIFF